jgi:hypothetical protein
MLTVTLADLKSKISAANVLGGGAGASYVRDRWNQRASVIVSDAGSSVFTSDSLFNVWRRGHAKLGTATGFEDGPDYVIPQ